MFFLNGLLTVLACWLYRQPLAFFWTIPGTVLVGPALGHLSFAEVVGAYYATGLLMLVLGLSGWVRRAMAAVPMPIVMGMVAGVFLRFGTDLVHAMRDDLAIAGPMVLAFLLLASVWLRRWLPPIIVALLVGVVAVAVSGRFDPGPGPRSGCAAPVWQAPVWSVQAIVELVVPLAITVLVVQNGQGVAVLRAAGHDPPVNAITIACGAWSLLAAAVGARVDLPDRADQRAALRVGRSARQYTAGIVLRPAGDGFGLFAPLFTRLMLAAPAAFIAMLGGLAMLRVLQAAFVTAFAAASPSAR